MLKAQHCFPGAPDDALSLYPATNGQSRQSEQEVGVGCHRRLAELLDVDRPTGAVNMVLNVGGLFVSQFAATRDNRDRCGWPNLG